MSSPDDLPPPILAATLVLMRDRPGGAPELLMMERSGTMAFAAGALVFPGGRIDPDDHVVADAFGGGLEAAAKVAAIRETIEETGIAPAVLPEPRGEVLAELRAGAEGDGFADLLGRLGLRLELDALIPFARWCPNFRETRRFDTLFYLARAPEGAGDPVVAPDEGERAFWCSATDVIGEVEAGHARAIFPTRRNLERLAQFGTFAEAAAHAAAHPVQTITPWIKERDRERFLCIPEGLGYPITAEPLATAMRG